MDEFNETAMTRRIVLSFSEALQDEEGAEGTELVYRLNDGETEHLGPIMEKFQKLLHAAGFDYVRLVQLSEDHTMYGFANLN
jgi:hypothetical protein